MSRSRNLFVLVLVVAVAGSACRAREPQAPGASLIEVVRAIPAGDFERVGELRCSLDDASQASVDQCEDDFRNRALALDADAVVIEGVSSRKPPCTEGCRELRASAYRRVLPWQRAVPAREPVPTLATARLVTGTGFV